MIPVDINESNLVATSPTLSPSQQVRATTEFLMALVNSEISGPPMEHDLLVVFATLCYIHFNMSSSFSLCILSTIFQATQAFPLHLAYAFASSRLLRTTLARNVPHSWGACQGVKSTSRESIFQWINSCLFNVTLQLP